MNDDDDTPPAPVTAAPEARSGWIEQDRRTLIITIVGGLAGNLGTVILVGAAIALTRATKGTSWRVESIVYLTTVGSLTLAAGIQTRRGRGRLRSLLLFRRRSPGW